MKFHIITLFPESFDSYFQASIMKKARENNLFSLYFYKLNDFSTNPTKRVDDKAYGMHGQVISPEPLKKAIEHIFQKNGKLPVIYMTPSGKLLDQQQVEEFSQDPQKEYIIICGHYEGIDQRVRDKYVDYEVSIGEYVLSSGELAAMVFIDACTRHIPGVLGNSLSREEESFCEKFSRRKEYPVYTRPQIFDGLSVPEVLVSGNHQKIEKWKYDNLQ